MTRSDRVRTYVLLMLSTAPAAAAAQVAAPPAPPPRREIVAAFTFVGTTGNASTQSLGLDGALVFKPDDWVTSTKASYFRNESSGTTQAQSVSLTHRTSHTITDRLSAFGQYAFLHDRFAGTRQRHSIDLGASYAWVASGTQRFDADAALGYAYEKRIDGPTLSSAVASVGGHDTWTLSKTSTIEDEARLTSSLSIARDWRVQNVLSASAALMTHLALKVAYTVRYVHLPAPGFKTTDTTTTVAVAIKY